MKYYKMGRLSKIPHIIWMLYGILLYEMAGLLSLFFGWSNYICMLGVGIAMLAYIRAPKAPMPSSVRGEILLFYVVLVFMALRGSLIGRTPHLYGEGILPQSSLYDIVRFFLVNPNSALAIFFPFVVTVDWRVNEFKYLGKIAIIASIVSIVAFVILKDYIISADKFGNTEFSTLSGYLSVRYLANNIFVGIGAVLCVSWSFQYVFSKKIYWLLLVVLFLHFYCNILGGGRGNSVIAFGYILLFFVLLFKSANSGYVSKKKVQLIFFVLIAVFVGVLHYLVTETSFLDLLIRRSFEGGDVSAGLRESTREEYMNAMITDFNSNPISWMFGRGVNGCYSLAGASLRSTIEWGYMWLILKGGIIYLILYVIILLKAFIKGWLARNMLAKSLGLLCLVQVLLLIPFGLPSVSVQCLLVWHSVRLLNSPTFLCLSDLEIHQIINAK